MKFLNDKIAETQGRDKVEKAVHDYAFRGFTNNEKDLAEISFLEEFSRLQATFCDEINLKTSVSDEEYSSRN